MKKKLCISSILILICLMGAVVLFIAFGTKNFFNKKDKSKLNPIDDSNFTSAFLKNTNQVADSNYLVSPYSVEVALSMLRDGANGNTKDEISKLIGEQKINLLNNNAVHIANALFIKDDYKDGISKTYSSSLTNDYKSEVLYDKFTTPDVINNWVDTNTDGMIKKVVEQMSPDFVLGLANAIAIDVKWKYEFECISTNSSEFTKKDDSKINVEMMHKSFDYGEDVKYLESDNAKGIILPYRDEDGLEFIAIRPEGSIDDYINSFTMDEINKMEEKATTPSTSTHISLSLPRFKYDYDLKQFMNVLINMGIKDVFDPNNADLTGLMSKDDMKKYDIDNLYVGEAVHKTHVDLNEKGTKAAAVTYFAVYKNTSIVDKPNYNVINISFDKSFLYMIRDKETKNVLFIGVVDSPNEWEGSTCDSNE